MLKVHYFNFWMWAARQAYPDQEAVTHDRYDRLGFESLPTLTEAISPSSWITEGDWYPGDYE